MEGHGGAEGSRARPLPEGPAGTVCALPCPAELPAGLAVLLCVLTNKLETDKRITISEFHSNLGFLASAAR